MYVFLSLGNTQVHRVKPTDCKLPCIINTSKDTGSMCVTFILFSNVLTF